MLSKVRVRYNVEQEKEADLDLNIFEETSQERSQSIDEECLRKYDERNERFSMELITVDDGVQQSIAGYKCIYRYGTRRIQLYCDIVTELWKAVADENLSEVEERELNNLLDDLNKNRCLIQCLTLDQQIQVIIKRFDRHFFELYQAEEAKRNEMKIYMSSCALKWENAYRYLPEQLVESSFNHQLTPSTILEDDEQQNRSPVDLENLAFVRSLVPCSRNKYSMVPPPVAPRRSRQNSACSTQSSVRYASFVPPPVAPVRRRKVIESIRLRVQRKNKPLEKFVDILTRTPPVTMFELGLEFLRVYDGKFNYPEGYTFEMSFRKKTWFLTIENIKRVECQPGTMEPRSLLLLNYKNQITTVRV